MVLAANEETGEVAYKEVVRTFVNTTDEITHVTIQNDEGEQESIDSTPQHPFYVEGMGWVEASSLHAGMTIWFANGTKGTVADISNEGLEEPVTVYNFEVEDFHTYFVGESGTLVHNACGTDDVDTTRVGRWMSEDEYNKMMESGNVQMSPNGNTAYVATPADINAFGKQAKPGSLYVEFDVDASRVYPAGNEGWGQIPGPGSLFDRLNQKKGLEGFTDMPAATNIQIVGKK